jgi:hypothetical protein
MTATACWDIFNLKIEGNAPDIFIKNGIVQRSCFYLFYEVTIVFVARLPVIIFECAGR